MFVGSIEIFRNNKLYKTYFQCPYVCEFTTEDIKYDLIWKANRNSDSERIEYLV